MVIDLERICLLKSSKSWCPHIFVLLPAPPKVHSPTQTRNGAYPAPNYLVYVTSLPLLYLTTHQILQKRNTVLIVLSVPLSLLGRQRKA